MMNMVFGKYSHQHPYVCILYGQKSTTINNNMTTGETLRLLYGKIGTSQQMLIQKELGLRYPHGSLRRLSKLPRVIKSSKWFSKGPGTALSGTRSANHRTQCPQNTALGKVGRKLWQKLRHKHNA